MPVWNLDIRRNSAPCFSKIAFASLAVLTISSYTGLRIGDVATLGRQHLKQRTIVIEGQPVRRTVISIDSEKTGMRVELPLLPQLEATLEAGPTGDLAFIVTRRGTSWTKGALGTEFVAAARAAGVVGNRPMACARPLRPGRPRTERPSASSRQSLAGPAGGRRPFTPKARTGAGLQRGLSAS
jgi:integrase